MKHVLTLIALFCALLVRAETIYVAQNTAGLDDGSSEANAHSALWFNTSGNWGSDVGDITAGDTVVLCGTITTNLTISGSGTAGSPITLLFASGAKVSAPWWDAYYSPTNAIAPRTGAITATSKHNITVDGAGTGYIEATGNDSTNASYYFAGIYVNGGTNWTVKDLSISNMFARCRGSTNYHKAGWGVWGYFGSGLIVSNCTIWKGGWYGGMFTGVSTYGPVSDWHITNNRWYGSAVGFAVTMEAATALSDVELAYNQIWGCYEWDGILESNPYDSGRTDHRKDGIKFFGQGTNSSTFGPMTIHHNVIGPDMSWESRGISGWLVFSDASYTNILIATNLFLSRTNYDVRSPFLAYGCYNRDSGTNYSDLCVIRNNTFLGATNTDAPINFSQRTTNCSVFDNLFVGYYAGMYSSLTNTSIPFWDYNYWYPPYHGVADFFLPATWYEAQPGMPANYYSWAQWKSVLGYDAHSLTNTWPSFVNVDNWPGADGVYWTADDGLRLQTNSSAIAAGRYSTDIGAYQTTSEPAPISVNTLRTTTLIIGKP